MRKFGLVLIGSVVGAVSAANAPASVVYLQDVGGNSGFTFNGTAVTQATFDDTYLQTGGSASTLNANFGVGSSMAIRTTSSGLVNYAILAVKDLFTLVPASSGGNGIILNSATLYLASSGSSQGTGYTINVRRITTDWLANPAGDNDTRASGNHRNAVTLGANLTDGPGWASTNFGSSDYSSTNAALGVDFANSTYGAYKPIDVTNMVKDMYTLGVNYGFAISTPYQQDGYAVIRSSEDTLSFDPTLKTWRPVLALDYTYVPEPASMTLLSLAGGLMLRRRRA